MARVSSASSLRPQSLNLKHGHPSLRAYAHVDENASMSSFLLLKKTRHACCAAHKLNACRRALALRLRALTSGTACCHLAAHAHAAHVNSSNVTNRRI